MRPIRRRRAFGGIAKTTMRNNRLGTRFGGITRRYSAYANKQCWGGILKSAIVPPITWAKMTFNKTGQLLCVASSTSFSATPQLFKLNSVYNIDGTLEALGYTNRSAQYWKYKVHAIDLEVVFYDPEVDNMWAAALITGPGETKTISDFNVQSANQLPSCCVRPLPQYGNQQVRFKQHLKIADLVGHTRSQFANDVDVINGTASFIGASPVMYSLLHLGVATADSHNIAVNATYSVNITYYVQWYDRKAELV